MKNKQLQFFLLEFTISLIILSVALVVAFTMFTEAAQTHTETIALRKLSEIMVIQAETLRQPNQDWANMSPSITTTYDAQGEPNTANVHYTLTITLDPKEGLNTADLNLKNEAGEIVFHMKVSALSELTP
jgi:hypothetical protein